MVDEVLRDYQDELVDWHYLLIPVDDANPHRDTTISSFTRMYTRPIRIYGISPCKSVDEYIHVDYSYAESDLGYTE